MNFFWGGAYFGALFSYFLLLCWHFIFLGKDVCFGWACEYVLLLWPMSDRRRYRNTNHKTSSQKQELEGQWWELWEKNKHISHYQLLYKTLGEMLHQKESAVKISVLSLISEIKMVFVLEIPEGTKGWVLDNVSVRSKHRCQQKPFLSSFLWLETETNRELLNLGSCSIKGESEASPVMTEVTEVYDPVKRREDPFTVSRCQVTWSRVLVS